MKKIFTLLVTGLFLILRVNAQVVDEDAHFDFYQSVTNNDFINHFSGGLGLDQIQTNGITGGCLTIPDSVSWGNDNAIYCSRYKPNSGDTTVTSICFKYDSTTVNLGSFQRALSIFLRPYADFNHYVIATVSGNKKLELITYGWVNTPYPDLNLLHNHWYRYILTTAFFSATFQVYIKAEVLDIGLTGTFPPIPVNSSSGTITDNILAVDTAIEVSILGATYGGCAYLDDFHFHGRKGFSNCILNTGISESSAEQNFFVYPSPASHVLHVENNSVNVHMQEITILNAVGEKIKAYSVFEKKADLDISALTNGLYFVNCRSGNETRNFKIVVCK
ncbi:MAG TPA: T9SS type A sorting domain-containing protein [Bacteroidia bacterium]|nr:T9SS type A sorting domain-containing protein [Bacteroidia bacterium]